jgi:hypothetical protein
MGEHNMSTLGDYATLIIAIATTASLLYISRQTNVTRQQTKGQFLLALDEQIEKSRPIAGRIVNEPSFAPVGEEWIKVWQLMSIFERMNIMVEDKILDIGLVDRLWGFLLVSIIANDEIFKRLEATGAEWQDFIDICYCVADNRQRRNDEYDAPFIKRVHKLNKQTRRLTNPFRY